MIPVRESLEHAFDRYGVTAEGIRCARVIVDTDEEIVVSLPEQFTAAEYAAFLEATDIEVEEADLIVCVWLKNGEWIDFDEGYVGTFRGQTVPVIPPALRREDTP